MRLTPQNMDAAKGDALQVVALLRRLQVTASDAGEPH